MSDIEQCPQCGGEGNELGTLGALLHLRCRQCGWTWGVPAQEEEAVE